MSKNSHVQMTWTDLSNITRCQVVTRDMFENHFKTKGGSLPNCILSLPYLRDEPLLVLPTETIFKPDDTPPRSLQAWCPRGEVIFGKFYESNGDVYLYCPRSFLTKQESLLRDADIQVTVGFELEFFLLNQDGTPGDSALFGETKCFHGDLWNIMTEVVDALVNDFDIPVWRYHSEAAPSQYEISIGPFGPTRSNGSVKPNWLVDAADSLVLAREAIYHIAAKYNKKATFVPKPFEGLASGAHTHLSLQRNGKNLFDENPEDGHSFLAGVLQNMMNLMLIYAPTGNSYDRLQPSGWAGAFQCLGTENKEAAIRVIRNSDKVITRFEIKSIDGTANPYLMLGSLVGSGLHGMRAGTTLPKETLVDPMTLPVEDRPPRFPMSLSNAIQVFNDSVLNVELFGEELHRLIVKMRSKEQEHWDSVEETLENKIKLLLKRY